MTSNIPGVLFTLVFVLKNRCWRIKGRQEGPILLSKDYMDRSQWSFDLRRWSSAAWLLGSRFRIPL